MPKTYRERFHNDKPLASIRPKDTLNLFNGRYKSSTRKYASQYRMDFCDVDDFPAEGTEVYHAEYEY